MKNKPEEQAATFDITALDAADEGAMHVYHNGQQTNWIWYFAGPGHAKAIAQAERLARERLRAEREKEQAMVNGRKWKAPDEDVESARRRNIDFIVERLIGWSAATINGQPFPFSEDNARKILADPRKNLIVQCLEFLGDEKSFIPRSATNSSHTPSDTSN